MSPDDIAILGYFTPKTGREEDCIKLAKELVESTWAEDDGCICYYFYQKQDNPGEWVFHERWRDWDTVWAHVKRLIDVYGPPEDGQEKGLPATIVEPWEKMEFMMLHPIM